jgi:hypothetical protein
VPKQAGKERHRQPITLDAFARVRLLSSGERDDAPATTYSFGGSILDGGVTATLSWE